MRKADSGHALRRRAGTGKRRHAPVRRQDEDRRVGLSLYHGLFGRLLVHPRPELVGKNVITDLRLEALREALTQKSATEHRTVNYTFENRQKFIIYTYYQHGT
jgi:hypothetical protein